MLNIWTILKWSGIIMGPILTGGAKIIEVYQLSILPWPPWTVEVAGGLIFFGSVTGLLIGYERANKELREKVKELLDGKKTIGPKVSEPVISRKSLEVMPIQLPTQTPTPSKLPTPTSPQIVTISPQDLVGLFAGRTTAEGNRLAAPYMNKWMKISGSVGNVHTYDTSSCVTLEYMSNGVYHTELRFEEKWTEHISTLRVNDVIHAVGKIQSISEATLTMEKCEITMLS